MSLIDLKNCKLNIGFILPDSSIPIEKNQLPAKRFVQFKNSDNDRIIYSTIRSNNLQYPMEQPEFEKILKKLIDLENLLSNYLLINKPILTLSEACIYLDISESHMYRMTSQRLITHFCPNGKKIFFRRDDLDLWLTQNPRRSKKAISNEASNRILSNKL